MRHYNMSPIKNNENLDTKRARNNSISSGEKSINRSKSFIHEDLEKINIKKEEKLKKELMAKKKIKSKEEKLENYSKNKVIIGNNNDNLKLQENFKIEKIYL